MEVTPLFVLAVWTSGIAAGTALVVCWRVAGPGYTWLAGAVVLLLGSAAALAGGGSLAGWGVFGAVALLLTGRNPSAAAVMASLTAVLFTAVAVGEGSALSVLSGGAFLGSVTVEMMLGHWYLVDPTLPRWALRRLAITGAASAVVDFSVLAGLGALSWVPGDAAAGVGFIVLAATAAVLMVGVVFALREVGYSGVMAATGLSYLALLTAIGAAVTGRLLVAGSVLS